MPNKTLQPNPLASPESEAGGVLTIDLAAIAANWKRLRDMVAPAECAGVVKANAYGCGIEQVVPALMKAGCRTFFVADVAEGRRVRALAPQAVIYILNGVMPDTAPAFADANLRPVINSMAEFAEWSRFRNNSNWRRGAALHVDTGMNRLGLSIDEGFAMAERVRAQGWGITLLMSHLACADTPGHCLNETQVRAFRELQGSFGGIPSSIANSSGIFLGPSAYCDLVRPGIALFGGNPSPGQPNPMLPVVDLKGRIAQVREINAGETVGYGATWTAAWPSRLAIVTAGYADGYFRSAGAAEGKPPAEVIVAGKRCSLVGRVSMDLIAVDVTDVPKAQTQRGQFVTLIGDGIGIDDLAAACGTIGYEVLTSLGKRYHRVYRD